MQNSLDRLSVRQILAEKDLRRPEQPSGDGAGGFIIEALKIFQSLAQVTAFLNIPKGCSRGPLQEQQNPA